MSAGKRGCGSFIALAVIGVVALFVWLFGYYGPMPWTREAVREETVLGERKNDRGDVTEQIVREHTVVTTEILFTPEGPRRRRDADWSEYFLVESNGNKRVFSVMAQTNFGCCGYYWPISNQTYWVGTGGDPGKGDKLNVIVFNLEKIVSEQVFDVVPMWETTNKQQFEFEEGNRVIILNTPRGPEKHELLKTTSQIQ